MDYWFDNLNQAGVQEVMINTHWLPERVHEYLDARKGQPPITITMHEEDLLGSAGTLVACKDWVSNCDAVISLYGDLLVTQRIDRIFDVHATHDLPVTLSLFHADEPWRRGIATVDESTGLVTKFIEKPKEPESDLAGAGMYVYEPSFFSEMAKWREEIEGPFDIGSHVLPRLAGRMKAYHVEGLIHDIGTMDSYNQAEELALKYADELPRP